MEEWIDIYRADGTLADTVRRGSPIPEGLFYRIVSIFTVNAKHEILLTRRAPNKSYAGQWENTAGLIQTGEEPHAAALRELWEETGIRCTEEDLIFLDIVRIPELKMELYCFLTHQEHPVEAIRLQEGETDAVQWHPLNYTLILGTSLAQPVKERLLMFWPTLMAYPPSSKDVTPWLAWAKELQALAQQGSYYTKDPYDRERFDSLSKLACSMLEYKTGIFHKKITSLFAEEVGYQTPKIETRAIILNTNKEILLVREKALGLWSLPGGWCDAGLGIGENCIKECQEEAGLHVHPLRLLMVENRSSHDYGPCPFEILKCYIQCEAQSGTFQENIETDAADYFSIDALPPLSKERTTEVALRQCLALIEHPEQPTLFD